MPVASEYQRDYTFKEWNDLPFDVKCDIWNQYWNPYKPEIGKSTRDAIVTEFRERHPALADLALDVGCGFFGHYVVCLFVIVTDGSIKVPRRFASMIVNKGVLRERIDDQTILVGWRDVGGSKCEYRLNDIAAPQ